MPISRSAEEIDELCESFKDTSLNRLLDDSSLSGEQEEFICSICRLVNNHWNFINNVLFNLFNEY